MSSGVVTKRVTFMRPLQRAHSKNETFPIENQPGALDSG